MSRSIALAALCAAALIAGACAGRAASGAPVTDPEGGIAVDASTLWDPNAPKDPIVAYRLRLATEPANPALYNNLANLYVMRGWIDEAIRSYKKAIDLEPRSPILWNNLGTAYLKEGKQSKAYGAFLRAVKIDEKYALGWYNIGVIYDQAGNYDRALEMYLKAASYKPDLLDVKSNPQSVANPKILAVRVKRYLEEEGNLPLPLEPMPE